MNNKKTFIIGAVAIAACLVLVAFLTGYPPNSADTVGTIGAEGNEIEGVEAADRYRADQIDDDDVELDDAEIQELLQDDEIVALVNDPDFQRIMDDDLARATVLGDNAFGNWVRRTGENGGVEVLARGPFVRRNMSSDEIATFARSTFDNADLQAKVMANPDLARSLQAAPELARAVNSNPDLARDLAQSTELQRALASPEVMALIARRQYRRVAEMDGFDNFLRNVFRMRGGARRTAAEAFSRVEMRRNLYRRAGEMRNRAR